MTLSISRGQLNFEYLLITGILLGILIPVLYTSLSTAYEAFALTRLDDVVSQLAYKANDVYKLGPGNKDQLRILVPSGITGATIAGNEITLHATFGKQNTSVKKQTEAQVIGNLDVLQGEYLVPVKAINTSLVRIGSGVLLLYLIPGCIGAPNFANPPTITIYGDDFTSATILQKEGVNYPSSLYSVVDSGTITFTAHPTEFAVRPTGPPYKMRVVEKNKTSNELDFWVYPSSSQCS